MPLNVPLEFERAVLERVRSGRYGSTDEVLSACLRALEFVEDHGRDVEVLRRELQEAAEEAARGESIPEDEAIQWLWAQQKEGDAESEADPVQPESPPRT